MNNVYLSIDIGSKNTVIADRTGSVLIDEPTVVVKDNREKVFDNITCGRNALEYAGKNFSAQLDYPVKGGVIENPSSLIFFLSSVISRLVPKRFIKPTVKAIVSVSCGLSNSEKRAIEEVCIKAGISEPIIVPSPISVGMLVNDSIKLIVDMGATKTEIALVGEAGIITGCSVDIGGEDIDHAITDYISDKYALHVPLKHSEEIKHQLASLRDNDMSTITIVGQKVAQTSTTSIRLAATELRTVIEREVDRLVEAISSVCMLVPKNCIEAVFNNGFYFSGGGMLLTGIAEYLSSKLRIAVKVIDNPMHAVAVGGAKFLLDRAKLERILNVSNLRI